MELAGHSKNGFLSSLSAHDFDSIRPYLSTLQLSTEFSLVGIGQPVTQIYFPHTAIISLRSEVKAGKCVEVAMIGRDGILGALSALGEPTALLDAVVLLPGPASVMEASQLRAVAEQSTTMREALVRHGQALSIQAQQSAACNASHSVEARLARWLLRVRDLCGSDRFRLTQEMIAQMIGARRNSVSLVAQTLQQANIIRYSRGHIEVRDVAGLRRVSCECYEAVRIEFQRLRLSA